MKNFWQKKKKIIVTVLSILLFIGLFPLPVRCSETIWPPRPPYIKGMPMVFNDVPLQWSTCYSPLTREFWKNPDIKFRLSLPLFWILITNQGGLQLLNK